MDISLSSCRTFKQRVSSCSFHSKPKSHNDPRNRLVATGDRIYFPERSNRKVSLFNSKTSTWSCLFYERRLEERFDIQLAWLESDKLFVFGPHPKKPQGILRYFDLVRENWMKYDPMGPDIGLRWFTAGALHEPTSQYVIFAGRVGFALENSLFAVNHKRRIVYKPNVKGHPPSIRSMHAMCASVDHVFVYGGRGLREEPLNDIHSLQVSTSFVWSQVKLREDAPVRDFHAMIYVSGRLFVYGGRDRRFRSIRNKLIILDLAQRDVVDFDGNDKGIVCETEDDGHARPHVFRPAIVLLGRDMLLFNEELSKFATLSPMD